MSSSNSLGRIIKASELPGFLAGLLSGLFTFIALFTPAFAQETVVRSSFSSISKEPVTVSILTGQSCLLVFDRPIGRLAISNQDPAEAVPVAPNQLVVNAKAPGRTRLTTWSNNDEQFIFFDIDVRANLEQIDAQVRALFPKEDIRLSQANGSVVISGKADPLSAQQIEAVVQAAGFKTVNLLAVPIQNMAQVQLQIRVAEVSRNKMTDLAASPAIQTQVGQGGYFNTGQGPYTVGAVEQGNIVGTVSSALNVFVMSNNAFMFIRALQQQGALRALAEPNLIAMNGQQASFLAGGEIPVPIVTNASGGAAVNVTFKEYGVRVTFKPTILDEQHIRLELEPEVSTLDYTNAVRFSGFVVPALRTRRAKTGIELQDGQSFGIAGLMDNNELKSLSKIPVLADVPVIGNLFKSKSFQRNESELVFIVTAKITQPLNPDAVPQMRGVDGPRNGSPLGVEPPSATKGATDNSNQPTTGSGGSATTGNGAPAAAGFGNDGGSKINNDSPGSGVTNGGVAPVGAGAVEDKFTPGGVIKEISPKSDDNPAGVSPPVKEPENENEDEKGGEAPEGPGQPDKNAPKPATPAPTSQPASARSLQTLVWRLWVPDSSTLTAQRIR